MMMIDFGFLRKRKGFCLEIRFVIYCCYSKNEEDEEKEKMFFMFSFGFFLFESE